MNIIIVGCGRVGQTLAEKLNLDGNDVTVVDLDGEKVASVTNRFDVMGVVGNGATRAVQQEAGIDDADLFIAVTNSDELNLLCCMIAKKVSGCHAIARIKNPEYSDETAYLQDELGLAMVINPEYAAAKEIARVLHFPSALAIEPFAGGRVELIKFRLQKDCHLVGSSIKDVMAKLRVNVLICTIERGEQSYIAGGDFVFAERDVVSIIATPKKAKDFFAKINQKGQTIKDVMVVGGGAIAHYLCDILEPSGISVKIIEKELKKCEEIASRWNKTTVIHGDAIERELLVEEGVSKTDAFVALANLDVENIMLSLFAKEAGAGKLVTKISHIDYDDVISRMDLDTVICPKNITADLILRYVRSLKNTQSSNIETLYNIIQDEVEAAEFIVKDGSPVIGVPLCDLPLKKEVLIASILRDNQVILPRGGDTIAAGDRVVVVTKGQIFDVADVLEK